MNISIEGTIEEQFKSFKYLGFEIESHGRQKREINTGVEKTNKVVLQHE